MPKLLLGPDAFRVEISGPENAPPLLLSNSLACDLAMWDLQMPAWTKRFRVIRYDARGHGGSAVSPGPYSIAQLAGDALAILDALHIETVDFCGLSMGGMVGQWLLTHAPQRIRRAVLANTAARMAPPANWNSRIQLVTHKGIASITQIVMERWFSPEFRQSSPEAVARIAKTFFETSPAGYAACCAAIRDMDQREAIRSVDRPVLVIVGSKDPSTPPSAGEEIRAAIPGARLVALDAAHLSNIEQPDGFTKAVEEFLA